MCASSTPTPTHPHSHIHTAAQPHTHETHPCARHTDALGAYSSDSATPDAVFYLLTSTCRPKTAGAVWVVVRSVCHTTLSTTHPHTHSQTPPVITPSHSTRAVCDVIPWTAWVLPPHSRARGVAPKASEYHAPAVAHPVNCNTMSQRHYRHELTHTEGDEVKGWARTERGAAAVCTLCTAQLTHRRVEPLM
jgi:hypothetical protein